MFCSWWIRPADWQIARGATGDSCSRAADFPRDEPTFCWQHWEKLQYLFERHIQADQYVVRLTQEVSRLRARLADLDEYESGDVVYFICRESDGLVKIGTSGQVEERMRNLSREHGQLKLLATVPGGVRVERDIHIDFAADRVTGEWFKFSKHLKRYIESLKQPDLFGHAAAAGRMSVRELHALYSPGDRL